MAQPVPGSNELTLASVLAAFLTLIIVFAVDSVESKDPFWYRIAVGLGGLMALGPIFIVLVRAIAATQDLSGFTSSGWYAIYTLLLMLVLVSLVVVKETTRGIDDDQISRYGAVIITMTLVWYLILYVLQ